MRIASIVALAAVAAALGLASGAPAGASRARTAALSPPTIHEPFTALPCTGAPKNRSTAQDVGCAEQAILKSDKKIDTLNALIFAKLEDNAARRDFTAGHNAWVKYRRAYCLSESDVFQGGTEATVLAADCEADLNTEHIKDLDAFLRDLSEND